MSAPAGPPAASGPGPLGPDFRRLWVASAVSNFGDGVYTTALPLLAASMTAAPMAVALVMVTGWLPWLLFSLFAGVLVDRWDRARAIWVVDLVRLAVVAGLAAAVLLDRASLPMLLACGFLLGTGQTIVDIAGPSLVPGLVSRDPCQLDRANGRLQGTRMLSEQFAGPPVGGVLFGVAPWLPLLVDAISFGIGSALMSTMRPDRRPAPPPAPAPEAVRAGVLADVLVGMRWLLRHRLLRTGALLIAAVNLSTTTCQAILVLFVDRHLGLGAVGYGVLLAFLAVGGGLGGALAPRLGRALGEATAILGGLVLLGVALLGLGLMTAPWAAALLLTASGLGAVVVNVLLGSLRQQLVPDAILGRVVSAMMLLAFGAVPVGALLGGVLATAFGLRAPFLIAGLVVPVLALAAAPVLNRASIETARAAATDPHT